MPGIWEVLAGNEENYDCAVLQEIGGDDGLGIYQMDLSTGTFTAMPDLVPELDGLTFLSDDPEWYVSSQCAMVAVG